MNIVYWYLSQSLGNWLVYHIKFDFWTCKLWYSLVCLHISWVQILPPLSVCSDISTYIILALRGGAVQNIYSPLWPHWIKSVPRWEEGTTGKYQHELWMLVFSYTPRHKSRYRHYPIYKSDEALIWLNNTNNKSFSLRIKLSKLSKLTKLTKLSKLSKP